MANQESWINFLNFAADIGMGFYGVGSVHVREYVSRVLASFPRGPRVVAWLFVHFIPSTNEVRLPHIGCIVGSEREVRLPHIGFMVGSEGYTYPMLCELLDRRAKVSLVELRKFRCMASETLGSCIWSPSFWSLHFILSILCQNPEIERELCVIDMMRNDENPEIESINTCILVILSTGYLQVNLVLSVPEDDLDHLKLTRGDDGAVESLDPQFLLGFEFLKAFNLALLQKWRWRLFTSPNDLWVKVVKAFHGHECGFDNNGCSFKGTWAKIVGSSNFLHSKGIILNNSFCFNAGCGTRIRFWKDIWVSKAPLSIRPNIGVQNLGFFRDMLNEIGQLNIVASEDTCVWNLGPNGTFTVKDARNIIDQKTLPSLPSTS
ncbi:hypothetical protein Tco_0140317 [Tanacetum coccineum]